MSGRLRSPDPYIKEIVIVEGKWTTTIRDPQVESFDVVGIELDGEPAVRMTMTIVRKIGMDGNWKSELTEGPDRELPGPSSNEVY